MLRWGGAAAAPFRNMRNGSAKLHDEVVGGIASRPSAVLHSTGTRGVIMMMTMTMTMMMMMMVMM
eukprot:12410063-Karenia_brevis.AAC.1